MTDPSEIIVLTATLGDSCSHLSRNLTELRQFTRLPFRQLVSDDGTANEGVKERQRAVCLAHGAEWVENPGPVYGISYNLNHLFEIAEDLGYKWAFLIEDAVRPGRGWLETALDALERVGKREWGGRRVGALGMASSYENWHLACAGVLGPRATLGNTFDQHSGTTYEQFWGSADYPHWNDGLWCWARLHPGTLDACNGDEAEHWPEIIKRTWRDPVRRGEVGGMRWTGAPFHGWQHTCGWPKTRGVSWVMGPSAWALHHLPSWRKAGRWRDGCTYYEGHLGVRLAREGILSLNCECPPWLHMSGLAFRVKDSQGKHPRHHEPTDGPGGILERDFGANGTDHADLATLARSYFKDGEIDAINQELSGIQLYMDPAWGEWA